MLVAIQLCTKTYIDFQWRRRRLWIQSISLVSYFNISWSWLHDRTIDVECFDWGLPHTRCCVGGRGLMTSSFNGDDWSWWSLCRETREVFDPMRLRAFSPEELLKGRDSIKWIMLLARHCVTICNWRAACWCWFLYIDLACFCSRQQQQQTANRRWWWSRGRGENIMLLQSRDQRYGRFGKILPDLCSAVTHQTLSEQAVILWREVIHLEEMEIFEMS